jgi:hypothetical protein
MVTIKKNAKKYNAYTLVMKDVTVGKLLNLYNSLRACANAGSPLAEENADMVKPALIAIGIEVED